MFTWIFPVYLELFTAQLHRRMHYHNIHNLAIVLTVGFCTITTICCSNAQLDPKKTLVWGPGLKADYVVPARFFYIQAVDARGNK